MPDFDAGKGGFWNDGDITYLQQLGLSADQIRNIVEQYPDGPASAGIQVPSNSNTGTNWQGYFYPGGGLGGSQGSGEGLPPGTFPPTGDPRDNSQLDNGPGSGPGPTNPYVPQAFSLTDPTAFFDPKFIDQYFNSGRGNLARSAGGAVSAAQRTAGAQAGAGNYLNKGAFVTGAGSQARSPYAGAFGQLEQGRAGALQENQQGLFGALNNKALMEEQVRAARQGFDFTKEKDQRDYEFMVKNYTNQWDLQNRQLNSQNNRWKEQNSANTMDYMTAAAQLAALFCWVAEAIYGETDPRTNYARYAVTVMWERTRFGRFLKSIYGRYGKRVAAQIKKRPLLKLLFRPVFEIIWRQGRNELESAKTYNMGW